MLHILAGSYFEAKEFAEHHNLRSRTWHYIVSYHALRGLQHGLYFAKVGSWHERRDLMNMFRILDNRQAIEIEIVE